MKIIPAREAAAHVSDLVEALAAGGLVCIPCRGSYRILADARLQDAITRLDQSKRRTHNRPALVMVSDLAGAQNVVEGTQWQLTKRLAKKFWPGALTMLLPPSDKLPPKIKKSLTRSTGTIGVRVTADKLVASVIRELAAPVLVSSANLEMKPGASSAATVRQRFARTVEIWVDAGDLAHETPSTLVAVTETDWKIVRAGTITHDAIASALA